MMMAVGIALGVILLVIGVPIFVVFAVSGAVILVYHLDVTWYTIGHAMFAAITKYSLVSLPLDILVGHLMLQGGLAKRLTDLCTAWFGHFRGGMAIASIVAVAFFSAISGSILASIITIGAIMIPEMAKRGYSKPFAAAVIASAAGIDALIPPSGNGIIYSSITGTSLSKIFMAGLIPGILQGMLLLIVTIFLCRKMPPSAPMPSHERWQATLKALPIMTLPVIILGGIYTGFLLPTEAAALACVVALILGFVVYKEITIPKVWEAFVSTARTSGVVLLMIATATFLSLVFVYTQVPQNLAKAMISQGMSPVTFLLLASLTVLILGTFLEAVPNTLITVPIFMVVAKELHIDLIHLYVPMNIFIGMGLLTPPVAVGAYTAASVSGVSPERVFAKIYPWFFLAMVASGVINILVPQLSLWLPGTMP